MATMTDCVVISTVIICSFVCVSLPLIYAFYSNWSSYFNCNHKINRTGVAVCKQSSTLMFVMNYRRKQISHCLVGELQTTGHFRIRNVKFVQKQTKMGTKTSCQRKWFFCRKIAEKLQNIGYWKRLQSRFADLP